MSNCGRRTLDHFGVDMPLGCTASDISRLIPGDGTDSPDRFRAESDVALLVEFEEGRRPSFFGLAQMEIDPIETTSVEVDLRTPQALARYFRQSVVHAGVPQRERG